MADLKCRPVTLRKRLLNEAHVVCTSIVSFLDYMQAGE